MSNVTTIDTPEGTLTINAEEFTNLYRRFRNLKLEEDAAKDSIRDLLGEAADATKWKKAKLSKYFKARYNVEVKTLKEQAELFSKLNSIIDGDEPSEDNGDD